MSYTTLKQKIGLISFGFFLTLVILEGGLRVAGNIQLSLLKRKNLQNLHKKDIVRILCIGESTTFLGEDHSYPNQLELILNASQDQLKFKVINQGVPGVDTNFILKKIKNWIQEFQPDIVIAMMGVNDGADLVAIKDQTMIQKSQEFFNNLRVNKLAKLLGLHLSVKIKSNELNAQPELNPSAKDEVEDYKTEEELTFEDLRNAPKFYRKTYYYSVLAKGFEKYDRCEQLLKNLIEVNLSKRLNLWMYELLGNCFYKAKKFSEMTDIIKLRFEMNPSDHWAKQWVSIICKERNAHKKIIKDLKVAIRNKPKITSFYEYLGGCYAALPDQPMAQYYFDRAEEIRNGHINPATQENFLMLTKILQEHNIQPIFMQYPMRSITPLKKMLLPTSDYRQLIFVDNEDIFKSAIVNSTYLDYFRDRFSGDFGHCTPKGNRLLASHVVEAIFEYLK